MVNFEPKRRLTGLHRKIALTATSWAAFVLFGCLAPAGRGRAPAAPGPDDPAESIAALIDAHNAKRASAGRPPLTVSEPLTAAARGHAEDMAARRRMSHRGRDGSSPFRRMARAGYTYERAGENVAYGQPTVNAVMRAWMTSPGHRRNILGKYSEIGAARATDESGTPYWCVTFGTPSPR